MEGQEEESGCTSDDAPHPAMSLEPLEAAGALFSDPNIGEI